MTRHATRLICMTFALLLAFPAGGSAAPSLKKAIWGPVQVDGVSQFPIYAELGAGIWQVQVSWADVAPTKPKDASDPADPAYRWPSVVDDALAEGRRHGIKVLVMLTRAPSWANGGKADPTWAPREPRDYSAFAAAASRRWPDVAYWMAWGEPSRATNFKPLDPETRGRGLTAAERAAPRHYARLLDAAYGRLKAVDRSDLVIGGNTFTTGDISPRNWIREVRLPSGRPPRMDLWGHNPFSGRKPDLRKPPLPAGFADFSDLDTLGTWLDRWQHRRGRKPLRMFLSEFTLQTDRPGYEFNFWVSRPTAAAWLKAAMRITRRSPRLYSLGWLTLRDSEPSVSGDELRYGLIDATDTRKPAFSVFANG